MSVPVRVSGAEIGAPIPLPRTLFLRRFTPWQLVRFAWINWKMLKMIRLSHPHPLPPTAPR
jgi:hypothetical protein